MDRDGRVVVFVREEAAIELLALLRRRPWDEDADDGLLIEEARDEVARAIIARRTPLAEVSSGSR